MCINYLGGIGKHTDMSWYITCHLVVRKMAKMVKSCGRNQENYRSVFMDSFYKKREYNVLKVIIEF